MAVVDSIGAVKSWKKPCALTESTQLSCLSGHMKQRDETVTTAHAHARLQARLEL